MYPRAQLGQWGETTACTYLQQQGYKIITRNYRSAYGEIDIIAQLGSELSFVEVKTRQNLLFGTPAAAVTRSKQLKIHRTALEYLQAVDKFYSDFGFDVIEILRQDGQVTINHLKKCF
ncbi:MAG: YraN family protein [Acidaminococcaceae bacterium]